MRGVNDIAAASHTLTVRLLNPQSPNPPSITLDGKDTVLAGSITDVPGFGIVREGSFDSPHFAVQVSVKASGTVAHLEFHCHREVRHVHVHLSVSGWQVGRTRGLCGRFDFDRSNDLSTPQGAGGSARAVAPSWLMPPSSSLFPVPPPLPLGPYVAPRLKPVLALYDPWTLANIKVCMLTSVC